MFDLIGKLITGIFFIITMIFVFLAILLKSIYNLRWTLFDSELKFQIRERKRVRKEKVAKLKKAWYSNRENQKILRLHLRSMTSNRFVIALVDYKFDKRKILNNNGFTRLRLEGPFGTLFCKMPEDPYNIVVYGKLGGVRMTGVEMSMEEFIKKISFYY
jgi:hypothetical protein